jgi:aspartate oxidase
MPEQTLRDEYLQLIDGNLTSEQLSAHNIYQVGLLIARAALLRRESRVRT